MLTHPIKQPIEYAMQLSAQYPWHQTLLMQLREMIATDRLPQALFFRSRSDYFDDTLLWQMAQLILCDERRLCGQCQHCHLNAAKTHPNVLHLAARDTANIDSVRQMGQRIWRSPTFDKPQIVLIDGVDCLSVAAQNALLKNVEEPPAKTVFILTAEQPARVLNTMMSRVQRFKHPSVDTHVILHWLQAQLTQLTQSAAPDSAEARVGDAKTEAEIGAVAALVDYSPRAAFALFSDPEKVSKIKQDKYRFAQFMQGRCDVDSLISDIPKADLGEYLVRYRRYIDATIMLLFQKSAEQTDKSGKNSLQYQHWHGLTARRLYRLRDVVETVTRLQSTNVNLMMQLKTYLMDWQHDRQ
ncbi:DNA polymerase III subunit delta' [Ostreibacterium oceani]|uniref:DNA-directed DNA polymerase n=1 Tax=Ostreibacterium oceani TaxID=2654998 RepID=A0A6N7EZ50_9GAMM|nr:DNA polymerase III subunit delta' [Ostreibacterium oceani]MPV86815.1 hypothetical protein [Ostreibacterium oceani]